MDAHSARYCRSCQTRLARDNRDDRCAGCTSKARGLLIGPPSVPPEFGMTPRFGKRWIAGIWVR
jgi:hypothetical protein